MSDIRTSFDHTEDPMSGTSNHHDEYYSPTSPVGMVRAERLKYLAAQPRARNAWEQTERFDPSSGTIVDPAHEAEGAGLLLNYYEAVSRDRRRYRCALATTFFGLGGLGALLGWLLSAPLIPLSGALLATVLTYLMMTGQVEIHRQAETVKRAFESAGYFRPREILDGYLITTHSSAVVWEATELEQRRRAADYEAARLRGYRDLTHDRDIELAQLQNREQELRRKIVDMLDDRGAVEVNA